tara:strand:+ start:1997 stop:2491 length:495 start_codon:yes stop_codon:yes gene_type:complete
MAVFRFIDQAIEKGAAALLVLAVALMLGLSVFAIVMRWFETSYHWLEPFVRHLVFLSTFLGGVIATGRGTHIAIDILHKKIEDTGPEWLKHLSFRTLNIASSLVLFWLVKASWDFTVIEFEYGREVFWGIHSGILVGIIPFGLSLIAYRFLYRFMHSFTKAAQV